jgi:RNA polymerase sigma-70 factor (ECF subfamily)
MKKKAEPTPTQRLPVYFEDTFFENWPWINRLLTRLVGDEDEAEDLALETFLRLEQQPVERLQSDYLKPWLCRVATNLGLNALRSNRRRGQYEKQTSLARGLENEPLNPAELFTNAEEHRRVREVLAEMNQRQVQILTMRHSGRTYQEIAAALMLAPTSIGPLLVRAEREFKRRFCEIEREEL